MAHECDAKTSSSVLDVNDAGNEEATFGSRLLVDEVQVFTQNAWDHVEWDEEQETFAQERVEKQLSDPVPVEERDQYLEQPAEFWNKFYEKNENRFFKDRHWLRIEFPELFELTEANMGERRVFEIGCGAGNTLFPLLQENKNPDLFVYAADYSSTAVQVVRNSPDYDPKHAEAFVWDLASDDIPSNIAPGSLDVIVLVFVLSALTPEEWKKAIRNMYEMLKPGGRILFRDYGRHDLTQLRFKGKRLLDDHFYIRGDGTRVYFFTSEQIAQLFTAPLSPATQEPPFAIEQNAVDRRLTVNRSKKLKMYRVWLQGKFRKLG